MEDAALLGRVDSARHLRSGLDKRHAGIRRQLEDVSGGDQAWW
jgi:hypothetical protein